MWLAAAGGQVPVYSGVGGNLNTALEWAKISEEKGVDGYLLLPPYLIHGEQEGLYEYAKTIIESTNLNAILYQRDNAVLSVQQIKRLTSFEQLVGVKDGVGDMDLNVNLSYTIGSRLSYINGLPMAEVTMPAYLPIGFHSYSSAISNYIPHISRMFYHALKRVIKKRSRTFTQLLFYRLTGFANRKGYAVSLIKAGMNIMGHSVRNSARPPVVPVEKNTIKN